MNSIQASSARLQDAGIGTSLIFCPQLMLIGSAPAPSSFEEYGAFPIPVHSLPALHPAGQMGPPRSNTSHQSSRHPSPSKTPATASSHNMPPPPVPAHAMVYDPALYQSEQCQYQPQYQYQQPQSYEHQYPAGPSYSVPGEPFYYDVNGTGAAYALPVTFEPYILPDGQSLDDLSLEYSGNVEDLVEQWVTLEEDTGETSGDGGWTMQAPDLAVSDWDNLARMSSSLFIRLLDILVPPLLLRGKVKYMS